MLKNNNLRLYIYIYIYIFYTINNVYNANDIYELIKLNIGGVLTCFDCTCIEWCHHNDTNVTNKIFYKDIFVNTKKDLIKCDVPIITNKSVNSDIIGTHQINNYYNEQNNNYHDNTYKEFTQTHKTNIDPSQIKSDHINEERKEHYDYIIFPSDIINNTQCNNNNLKDYIKSMLILKEDAYIDFD
ncbi:dual-specificity protein phosphatase, partial [Plasmodium falciparum RAJ116]